MACRPADLDGAAIVVSGARANNLRSVSLRIPRAALTVITGVSGSGKSSLAFDTLYAEGQRRYVESLSTYARQFLERMPRPDVDAIGGLPPAIAIEQRNGVRNARSTVGTATEIADYLRLLFARVGVVRCPSCGRPVERESASAAAARLCDESAGRRLQVVAEVAGALGAAEEGLRRQGYLRLLLDGMVVTLDDLDDGARRRVARLGHVPLLIDRLRADGEARGRLAQALEAAFALSGGRAVVVVEGEARPRRLDEGHRCAACDVEVGRPEPALFSYNSPLGACPACQGFGRLIGVDLEKVIPDGRRSVRGGAIAPFQTPANRDCQRDLERAAARLGIDLDRPWSEMAEEERRFVLDGEGRSAWRRGRWYGVRGFFSWLESKKYKMHVRVMLARYRGYEPCAECQGTRLRREARSVLVGGRSIAELEAMPVGELLALLRGLALGAQERAVASPLLREMESRLAYLEDVGLEYLTLIRQARTLSGGEAQRIALAAALGARLTGTLYVLDEPSVGLHARDTGRLLGVLGRLVERGNTVVVVEHDPEIIAAADHVVDLGPGAGAEGGHVVFAGGFAELARDPASRTGELFRRRSAWRPPPLRAPPTGVLRVVGARANNLKGVTVEFPLGLLTCVTGVSGSGKSTLVEQVLFGNLMRARGEAVDEVGRCEAIVGAERLGDVVLVDQTPIGRSSRSNPATYLKTFDELRKMLARTADARRLGLGPGAFSFNVGRAAGGGRCEACAGQGTVTLEMQFLADVTVPCEACGGRRFDEKVLGVRLRGMNVDEILGLTVREALARFADVPKIIDTLRPFDDVGLGYLRLGQATSTLSGGESQRLKLAAHLRSGGSGKLFLLDEPTTGLHAADVQVLLAALARLREAGHTIVVVEHNLDFIREADHLIDLGPEGGERGGEVVAVGAPREVALASSHTGRALARLLGTARPGVLSCDES